MSAQSFQIQNFETRGTNAEVLQVIDGQVVAKKVQQSILQHAPVTVGQNETVPVRPVRVLGVEVHEFVEEHMGHGSHAHGGTGVPRVSLEGGIDLSRGISIRRTRTFGRRRGEMHTARVRMVLMANWSRSEYGMMALRAVSSSCVIERRWTKPVGERKSQWRQNFWEQNHNDNTRQLGEEPRHTCFKLVATNLYVSSLDLTTESVQQLQLNTEEKGKREGRDGREKRRREEGEGEEEDKMKR